MEKKNFMFVPYLKPETKNIKKTPENKNKNI